VNLVGEVGETVASPSKRSFCTNKTRLWVRELYTHVEGADKNRVLTLVGTIVVCTMFRNLPTDGSISSEE